MRSPTRLILAALAKAPHTNAELQELLETHSGDVARTMAKLRGRGVVERRLVRGRAVYRLAGKNPPGGQDDGQQGAGDKQG